MRNTELPAQVIVLVFLFVSLIGIFGRVLYTRLQIHTLELLLTLAVASVPLGVSSRIAYQWGPDPLASEEAVNLVALGGILAAVVLGGTVWGLSWVKKRQEQRPWHRLRLIVCGWLAMLGASCLLPLLLLLAFALLDWVIGPD